MQTNAFSFASRLRVLRENRRLSKTALAKQVGVSTTCVWNWEEGNTEPRPENLMALSKALNAPVAYLQNGSEWDEAPSANPAATPPPYGGVTLAEVIADAKNRIAQLAGIPPEKVNVSLEY
jgi:transcriptional regulator with XRE-family HTH domain